MKQVIASGSIIRAQAYRVLRIISFKESLKWWFDKLISVIMLPFILFFGSLAAIAILIEGKGSVFFSQKREGKNNKPFTIYKFRTMTAAEEADKAPHSDENSSRITKLGSFLRRTRLDELPQILNVIKGDMSLVGPRPQMIYHNAIYRDKITNYDMRAKVKPGITGLAQVSGQCGLITNADAMQRRVNLDLVYVKNQSLWLDIKILFSTILTVLKSFTDRG